MALYELKKQASFFVKEKIKTARLALTDVTPAQLLTEEVTNGGGGSPDTRSLKIISRAAFEIDDYCRIIEILHKRLAKFDRRNWRASYQAVIVLEHLMTHGPESVAGEFKDDHGVIAEMGSFQFIDEKGFNWGLNVRKKSERVLKLLENSERLKQERNMARKITRGIQGFGSFSPRSHSVQGVEEESTRISFNKCNSLFNDNGEEHEDENVLSESNSSKENVAREVVIKEEMHEWNSKGESNPLLNEQKNDSRIGTNLEEYHPFTEEPRANVSLLSASDQALQAY